MPATEAQIAANRRNASHSTGPKTPEGKEISRRNGLKHGMAGSGVVVPEADAEKVERRLEDLRAEMAPRTTIGEALLVQVATLSVRVERSFHHETAAMSHRVRHAGEAFDDARYDEAESLLDSLHEDPRKNLRKLMRMPEGVEAMIEAWQELRADLTRERRPLWTQAHRERAENLTGRKIDFAHGSQVNAISRMIWGDPGPKFVETDEDEANDHLAEVRKAKARAEMVAFIDAQVGALEAHYQTLDFAAIEADRAGAGDRALFDPSKEATLARRYESEALRNFHKAIKEFRRVEAEATERPAPAASPKQSSTCGSAGSSRVVPRPAPEVAPSSPSRSAFEPSPRVDGMARTADGGVVAVGKPVSVPR